jgi:hypothetical protein
MLVSCNSKRNDVVDVDNCNVPSGVVVIKAEDNSVEEHTLNSRQWHL